jgi:hypothetical protein
MRKSPREAASFSIDQTGAAAQAKSKWTHTIHNLRVALMTKAHTKNIQNMRPGNTSSFGLVGSVALEITTDDVSAISTS